MLARTPAPPAMPSRHLSLLPAQPPSLLGSDPREDNPLAPRAVVTDMDDGQSLVSVHIGGREVLFMRIETAILTEPAMADMWRHCLAPYQGGGTTLTPASADPAGAPPAMRLVGAR